MPARKDEVVVRTPTMSEIAKRVGVSVPTVSKVLNNRSDVSEQTRRRIEEAIRELGYIRNSAARALRNGRTGLVDLVVSDLESDYHLEIIRGVGEALNTEGIGMVLSAVHGQQQAAERWLSSSRGRTDGVILALSSGTERQLAELEASNTPVVVLDYWRQPDRDTPSIGATNFAGAVSATEHLIALGHRRIAFIGGPNELQCSRARLAGFRAAMEHEDLEVDPLCTRPGSFLADQGEEQTLALLTLAEPPTAIFAGSDLQAMGALRALRNSGISVPDEMSVVGFDDIPRARDLVPALTTVRQPLAEMGRTAASVLLRLIDGDVLDTNRFELATELILRQSTAPARRALT